MPPDGERKPVTILFADIVDSTAIAEQLDSEEWKDIVQGAHQRLSLAVERYGGMVAQLLGDGVLAFFGAPSTHEDDPERAVLAALDLQSQIDAYRRYLEGMVEDFQMRVGLHTGEVVLGEVGTDAHSEYLAVGDAVNLAARLQSAANPGQIMVSADVQKQVAHRFTLEDAGMLDLKGKTDKVHAFRVVEEKQGADPARGFGRESTPFVGREAEMHRLFSAIENLLKGRGGIVALLGEAGIGKSRLLAEARNKIIGYGDPSPERGYSPEQIHWLEGRAVKFSSGRSQKSTGHLSQIYLSLICQRKKRSPRTSIANPDATRRRSSCSDISHLLRSQNPWSS
jgi:class 3 adenylate cyclase